MTIKTVFFMGDESRYGLAHLQPILEHFDVLAVVVGTRHRWQIFRRALNGDPTIPRPHHCWANLLEDRFLTGPRRQLKRWLLQGQLRRTCDDSNTVLARVDDVNSAAAIRWLEGLSCDVVLSAAYPQIFKKDLLTTPPLGAINFHPSLLPKYRGAHPHFWAIAKGENESGITAHYMTEDIDQGALVAQLPFSIAGKYYSEVYSEIELHTPELVRRVADSLAQGEPAIPQAEEGVSQFRNDREIHRRLFWGQMNGEQLMNLVRTEVAFCFFNGEKVRIDRATRCVGNRNLTNGVRVPAGVIVDLTDEAIVVSTGSDREVLCISEIAGATSSRGLHKWVQKRRLVVGARFD